MHVELTHLENAPHRTLCFQGESLVDWLDGHRHFLDGRPSERFGVGHGYRFDAAVGLGDVSVVYEQQGTKGVLRRANGVLAPGNFVELGVDLLREIDRSFYQAEVYRFPVALLRLPDGREAIAHCPRGYEVLDLELLDGTRLTSRDGPHPDVFHSRLAASPDGRWLLSLGWVWQPFCVVGVWDVERALREPAHLSSAGLPVMPEWDAEVVGAAFCGEQLVVSRDDGTLGVFDLREERYVASHQVGAAGTLLMAAGPVHVAALDGTPRVYSLATGQEVLTVTGLPAIPGEHQPSVSLEPPAFPVVARDPERGRFAVGDGKKISVVTLVPD